MIIKKKKITVILINTFNSKDKTDRISRIRWPPNLFLMYSGIV